MNAGKSYAKPVEVGDVMEGRTVARVVDSNLDGYQPEDIVFNPSHGWQEYAISSGKGVRKIDPSGFPLSYSLSVLGMPGLTAYTGLANIGQPQPGETLVVAAASGAVGSVVGQIGRIRGCRVIGIAGSDAKCRYVQEELGVECLNHREPNLSERLQAACPRGIDVYFENVGGHVFEAVLPLLNEFARIPVCGLIAHYNATDLPPGPDRRPLLMQQILIKRLTFRGFIVWDSVSGGDEPVAAQRASALQGRHHVRAGERAARVDRLIARGEFWQEDHSGE
jgi:NADPH-dependent curcumin reductase CurA